jgi:hypothetical protein
MILAGAKLRAELHAAFGVLAFALTTVGEYSVTRSGPRARWSASPFKDIPVSGRIVGTYNQWTYTTTLENGIQPSRDHMLLAYRLLHAS